MTRQKGLGEVGVRAAAAAARAGGGAAGNQEPGGVRGGVGVIPFWTLSRGPVRPGLVQVTRSTLHPPSQRSRCPFGPGISQEP